MAAKRKKGEFPSPDEILGVGQGAGPEIPYDQSGLQDPMAGMAPPPDAGMGMPPAPPPMEAGGVDPLAAIGGLPQEGASPTDLLMGLSQSGLAPAGGLDVGAPMPPTPGMESDIGMLGAPQEAGMMPEMGAAPPPDLGGMDPAIIQQMLEAAARRRLGMP